MKAILVLPLLLLPPSVQANVIFVDFSGTVTDTGGNNDYVAGGPISGRVTIDVSLAGPDIDPRPNLGRYGSDFGEHPAVPNFVTNSVSCQANCPSTDAVFVANGNAMFGSPDLDMYQLDDNVNSGAGLPRFIVAAFAEDIVDDEGIVQSFELSKSDLSGEETMFGVFINKANQFLGFMVDHLSVRPGRCSIH
jgi:hypothetical protein